MLQDGLYEQVISKELDSELSCTEKLSQTERIDSAEASNVLAKYVAGVVEQGLEMIRDEGGSLQDQIRLVNRIITAVSEGTSESSFDDLAVADRAEQLLALYDRRNRIWAIDEKAKITRPISSIAQSSLFTGAVNEPQMYTELKKEIVSCNRIDMLVSFVKWSGLRLIIDELTDFTQKGGELRLITTSYMGATDVKAIERLSELPNTHIKISYDTRNTRLHAKAYIFYRDTGFTTAYVGSSNLSNAALTSGLEWNTKITQQDLPETMDKIRATFEFYWNDTEFETYDEGQRNRFSRALKAEKIAGGICAEMYFMEVRPYGYQQEILDRLRAEREVHGYFKNLIVAATGTGKTVISAFDYRDFRKANPGKPCRLLFVAHREEILRQSLSVFRSILQDANFGELFVGSYRPDSLDHLFISIQTFHAQDFTSKTTPDFYDYIIVDEFHHAAAPTYKELLTYYHPRILLGLTATPERMDGKSVTDYFNGRTAAEIRLPEAIDRKLLCPFQYFGVTDVADLSGLKWSAGGYDKAELSRLYTFSGLVAQKRAEQILRSVDRYVTDINTVKGLGFCVSVEHAEFMCRFFSEHGVPSMFLTGKSPDEERHAAKEDLVSGKVRFIFVVDIYNEGVDIPDVNTVLFLRPTESLTIFLQQLGRGLRLSKDKDCLTVLDFIGQANKRYNFEEKFAALLSTASRNVAREIQEGFVSAPKGCYIQLEKKATQYILENIRASYGNCAGLVSRIASFKEDTGRDLSLSGFLDHEHLDPRSLYKFGTFSRLCVRAGVAEDFTEDLEETVRKALTKLAVIDSRRWIAFLLDLLQRLDDVDFAKLSGPEKRMLQMFYVTLWGKTVEDWNSEEAWDNLGVNTLHWYLQQAL